jgi:hypothetical protein
LSAQDHDIAKYLRNILSDPSQRKYRSINLLNKAFQEKVIPATHALEYLAAIGFTQAASKGVSVFMSTLGGQDTHTIEYTPESVEQLRVHFEQLVEAMVKLGVSAEERPVAPPMYVAPTVFSCSGPVSAAFDPYKSTIVRNAEQVL